MVDLISVKEAQEKITAEFRALSGEVIPTVEALGRVLFNDLIANSDLPPFTNSGMDGFAVCSSDVANASTVLPIILDVIADIPAGVNPDFLIQGGQAARIMTGAVLPEGADTVIPIEESNLITHDDQPEKSIKVMIFRPGKAGEFIRPQGQDIHNGSLVMSAGKKINPQDMGLFAALGISNVTVYRRPKIALLATGDELIELNQPLQPGKIRNSNSITLISLIQKYGGNVIDLGIAPDDPEIIYEKLCSAVENSVDFIITSAGVSVGTYDHVRTVIEDHGEISLWRVNMRPGKPLVYGNFMNVPIIGLPGNPVSAFVGFLVFIVPVLRKLSGMDPFSRKNLFARLAETIDSDGRESYLRCNIKVENGLWVAQLSGHQGSGNIVSLVNSNALLIVPSGVKSVTVNSLVEVWPLTEDI